jgi:hypothetical protein
MTASLESEITASLAFLTLLTFTLIFLFSYQQATASENFKIRVWLANVKPDTGQVQLCVDVNTTFSSVCNKFDAGALKIDYNVTEAPVVNAGTFNLTRTQAPLNSTFDVCVYVFKTDTGDCDDGIVTANLPKEEGQIQDLMLFTRISPVYYDKQDGRLYHFEHCYTSHSTDKNHIPPTPFCYKDEGVAVPNPDYPRK